MLRVTTGGSNALGLLLGAGLFVPLLTLAGWAANAPFLYDFGIRSYPFWPIAAVANVALGLGQALGFSGRGRVGGLVLTLPMAIGSIALVEYAGLNIGIDRLLFSHSIQGLAMASAGRPGLLAAIALIANATVSLIAFRSQRIPEIILFWLCAIVMGFGWLSASLLLFGFGQEVAAQSVRLTSSLPGAVTMILLAAAPLAHRAAAHPAGLLGRRNPSGRAMTLSLPVLLILPVVLLPLERALAEHGLTTPFSAYVLSLAALLVLGVTLIALSVMRIARAHTALIESESRLAHALEAHRIGLFDWELKSDRLRWSAGAEERMGVAPGTFRDIATWMSLVVPEDAAQLMAAIDDVAARKLDRHAFLYRMRRSDGELRTIEGSARCFYNSRGALVRLTGVNLDITDSVRHEAEIARREAQWLSILRAVPDAMVVIDREGVVKSFSTTAERMFGYPADAVVGHNAMMLLPEDDARVVAAQLAVGIVPGGSGRGAAERVFTGRRNGGAQFPAECRVGEAMIDGEPTFTIFVRDISDRQAAEGRFAALQSEYAHSARLNAVGELASGLAHELNQPLAAGANFLGTAELLLDGVLNAEPVAEMIRAANDQVIRAGEIIRRLRDFIAKSDADMRVEPLRPLLREAAALALVGARQQQIEIVYDLDPEARSIFADRIQIQQVVVNLVRNAAQALRTLPDDRRIITISARPVDEESLEVSITDQGRGLPPEILEQLFAPFRSTKRGEGLGIGLSICRRIIEMHGGTLDAANVDGGGARISFTLARVAEEQGAGEPCVTSMS